MRHSIGRCDKQDDHEGEALKLVPIGQATVHGDESLMRGRRQLQQLSVLGSRPPGSRDRVCVVTLDEGGEIVTEILVK